MIRVRLTQRRRELMVATLDVGDPPEAVFELLSFDQQSIVVPIRQHRDITAWLGRAHAHFGLGYPTLLARMRARLANQIVELDEHPAMYGHGMLGVRTSLGISCWEVPGARKPDRLYTLEPIGREGFLVPMPERFQGQTVMSWTFEPAPHGPMYPSSDMFRSTFAGRGAVTDAAAIERIRAAILADG